jgi:hypothetical protein
MAVSKRSKVAASIGAVIGTLRLDSFEYSRRRTHWTCTCLTCGAIRRIRSDHLERFIGAECRCDGVSFRRTHGHSREREYKIWIMMLERCHNPKANNFRHYGGKGRFVCSRWRESFDEFLADMGRAPSTAHTLDRIQSSGSYTCGKCDQCKASNQPANVRWATKDVQDRNQVSCREYTHDGKTMILKDWARHVEIGYLTLHNRLERGWSFADAISKKVRPIKLKSVRSE